MSRPLSLLFAILCYAIFFATFLYLIVFVGGFSLGSLSPRTVDSPVSTMTLAAAVVTNLALIALFGVQHSVMARQGFKKAWTKIVPPTAERSMFVLISSVALMVMFRLWQPIDTVIWDVENPVAADVLWVVFWLGWGTVLVSTFLMNHFELFGLQQAWLHMRGQQAQAPQMREPSLYRLVRHPMMSGFFLAFWGTPHMTGGHLLLAFGMSLYIVIALQHEERDLISLFGGDYENYRSRVGMLVPRFRSRA